MEKKLAFSLLRFYDACESRNKAFTQADRALQTWLLKPRDVRSGEAGEAVPHLKNCAKKHKNKSI